MAMVVKRCANTDSGNGRHYVTRILICACNMHARAQMAQSYHNTDHVIVTLITAPLALTIDSLARSEIVACAIVRLAV